MSANGDLVVAEAARGVGTREVNGLAAPYTNTVGRQEWCGAFVEYVYRTAIGVPLKKYTSNPFYVSTCWLDMKKRGFTLGVSQAAPGDIIFFNWDGGREDHMGIVESVAPGGGSITTIEGNSGNQVKRQSRQGSTLIGVARIPEIADGAGVGGPDDPNATPGDPVGMDYAINIFAVPDEDGDEDRIYEGELKECVNDGLIGWNTESIGRGKGKKIQLWCGRGNYSLDSVTLMWDFAGKANPD